MTAVDIVPFEIVAGACAGEGLTALAVLNPPPSTFPPEDFDRLLADGTGDMESWLRESRPMRLNPVSLLPTARAILVVALPYAPERSDGSLRRGRYAAGKDYHNVLRPKLGRVGIALNQRYGATWRHRATVDSAPINERSLALRSGLGWIGRNALLIAPDAGSYRVLGTLLTQAPLEARQGSHGDDRCGTCRACETRCPTAAISDGRVISERCISYLTIEHQGIIPRDLAERFAGWWFGCDLCQEACPWNRFAGPAGDPRLGGTEDDARLLAITATDYGTAFAGRAMRRVPYERFRRNLLVALFSLGRRDRCQTIIGEGLPLVLAQARELGLTGPDTML